jgi:hypothetical protein
MERIFVLNEVGRHIWQQIDGHTTLETIRDGIVYSFRVDPDTAGRDLQEFIDEVLAEDLIAEVDRK